jgi:hypothetical protein
MNRATYDVIAITAITAITVTTGMITTATIAGMIGTGKTIMIMDMIGTTAIAADMPFSSLRAFVVGSVAVAVLLAAPVSSAETEGSPPASQSDHDRGLVTRMKRDAKTVGAAFKEGAHRVAVASKAVAHEVATAAKRGAAETRAAFRAEKSGTPAS